MAEASFSCLCSLGFPISCLGFLLPLCSHRFNSLKENKYSPWKRKWVFVEVLIKLVNFTFFIHYCVI